MHFLLHFHPIMTITATEINVHSKTCFVGKKHVAIEVWLSQLQVVRVHYLLFPESRQTIAGAASIACAIAFTLVDKLATSWCRTASPNSAVRVWKWGPWILARMLRLCWLRVGNRPAFHYRPLLHISNGYQQAPHMNIARFHLQINAIYICAVHYTLNSKLII